MELRLPSGGQTARLLLPLVGTSLRSGVVRVQEEQSLRLNEFVAREEAFPMALC